MAKGFERFGIFPGRYGSNLVRDLSEVSIKSGPTKTEVIVGGDLDRSAVVNAFCDPMLSFSTRDFAILSNINLQTGYAYDINGSPSTTSTILQFQKRLDGGSFAGSGHYKVNSDKGFSLISGISAEQDSPDGAKLDIEIYALSTDGEADALDLSSAALVSTPLFNTIHYLGPVWIGDVTGSPVNLRGVQSVSIKPGVNYKHKRGEGAPFAVRGSIVSRTPEIKIVTNDIDSFYNNLGGNLFATDITAALRMNFFFQKGVHGSDRLARSTAQHVRITAQTGELTADEINVRNIDDATLELTLRPTGSATFTATQSVIIPAIPS